MCIRDRHSVLGYEVINASFTQLLTQLGIVLYGNTLIVNNDAGNGAVQLSLELIYDFLLGLNCSLVRQFVHLPIKVDTKSSSQRRWKEQNTSEKIHFASVFLGRWAKALYVIKHLLS